MTLAEIFRSLDEFFLSELPLTIIGGLNSDYVYALKRCKSEFFDAMWHVITAHIDPGRSRAS